MMVLGKKELIGGTVIAIVIFVAMGFCLKLNNREVYYQIIFDSDGGTEVAGQNVIVNGNAKVPSTTIREGYVFKGWYLDDEEFDFSTKISKDVTLTAKWEKIVKEDKTQDKVEDKKEASASDDDKKKDDVKIETKKNDDSSNKNNVPQQKVPSSNKPIIVDVSSVTFNQNNISLKVNESSTIIATVLPDNATDKSITWSSSNSLVATVSNGVVYAVSPGSAIITANVNGKSATCMVTVVKNVTYRYEIVDTPSSSIGQCDIYIKSSDGEAVSGMIIIHYTNGKDETVNVTPNGVRRIRSAISSVSIVSVG